MGGPLRNRDYHVPRRTVAVSHRVTIFVPEPSSGDRHQPAWALERGGRADLSPARRGKPDSGLPRYLSGRGAATVPA
jgi:hypothetical protein